MLNISKAYGSVPCLGECGRRILLNERDFERAAHWTCPDCHRPPEPVRPQLPRFTRTGGFRALDERIRDAVVEGMEASESS